MRGALIIGLTTCFAISSVLAERVAMEDVLYKVGPRYPSNFRRANIGGTGRFRMNIDFKTGKVTSVTVVKSTGIDGLDREAIFALRRWRFKPGKAREVEIPITFYNGKEPLVLPQGTVLTPRR